jgi:hypothetical protein
MRVSRYLFLVFCLTAVVHHDEAMFQRGGSRKVVDTVPPAKRFKADATELFLSNTLSAERTQDLFNNAYFMDKGSVEEFVKDYKHKGTKNVARDIRRKMKKGSKWPSQYVVNLTVFDPKTQTTKKMQVPFWLPHEVVGTLFQANGSALLQSSVLDRAALRHLQETSAKMACQSSDVLALGLWMDATPFNRDRSKSLEIVSLNFPGLDTDLRIPICAIPKDFISKKETYDEIMAIVAWSFQQLYKGQYPSSRHDGSKWGNSDAYRKKKGGSSLPRSLLVEVRGDWSAYKHNFKFPGWQEKAGCCWLCPMTPDKVHECSSDIWWKKQRLSHSDVILGILKKGHAISPIFSIPHCTKELFKIDWLHAVDMGVAQDFLGSLFVRCLRHLPGKNQEEQCASLHRKMIEYYKAMPEQPQSKMLQLKLSMLKKRGSPYPKLRAKGGEVKSLIPFAEKLAKEVLGNSAECKAIKLCASSLLECYKQLSKDSFAKEDLLASATKFGLQYAGLHKVSQERGESLWPMKPKFHMFQELCFTSEDSPAKYFTYRDESFGGFVSSMCERRGGAFTPLAVGQSFFDRFAALFAVPVLV